jgi:hypothetical protein
VLWVFLAASAAFAAGLVTGQALAIERHPLGIGPSGAPLAVPGAGGILAPLGWIADGLIVVCWLIIVGRQVGSYRHSTGNRRQRLKWLIGGAGCCVVATAITIFAGNYSSELARTVHAALEPAHVSVWIKEPRTSRLTLVVVPAEACPAGPASARAVGQEGGWPEGGR